MAIDPIKKSIKWRYGYHHSSLYFRKTVIKMILRRYLLKRVFARSKTQYKYALQVVGIGSAESMTDTVVSGLRHYSVLHARMHIVEDWAWNMMGSWFSLLAFPYLYSTRFR